MAHLAAPRNAKGDVECRVEGAGEHQPGRVDRVGDPGWEQVARWEDEEGVAVERGPLVELHGGVERPAFVDLVQAVADERSLVEDAEDQQREQTAEIDGAREVAQAPWYPMRYPRRVRRARSVGGGTRPRHLHGAVAIIPDPTAG
jgi:hypothetical protein